MASVQLVQRLSRIANILLAFSLFTFLISFRTGFTCLIAGLLTLALSFVLTESPDPSGDTPQQA